MLNDEMKQRIADKVTELVNIAKNHYKMEMAVPPIFYDCHNTWGGYHKGGTLHFNPTLAFRNFESYLTTDVIHETAHYVQWVVFPESLTRKVHSGYMMTTSGSFTFKANIGASRRRVHGREWKSVMRLFGISNPERTHDYDIEDLKKKTFKRVPVYCSCSVHEVTLKIANKMQLGKAYTCRTCKTRVSLVKPA